MALYDTDNNVQMACLKIIEGDNSKSEQDSWKSVEKPPKKEPNREDKVSTLTMASFHPNPRLTSSNDHRKTTEEDAVGANFAVVVETTAVDAAEAKVTARPELTITAMEAVITTALTVGKGVVDVVDIVVKVPEVVEADLEADPNRQGNDIMTDRILDQGCL